MSNGNSNGSKNVLDPSLTSNTTTIGLTKDLMVPIMIKLCYLQPSPHSISKIINSIASSSDKYSNPSIFQKLSQVYINSDLAVEFAVFDGNHNPISISVQTSYQSFTNNRRIWNRVYKLPINYSQVPIDAYIKITVFEIVKTRKQVFGVGYLSVFNRLNSTIRKGSFKVAIHTNGPNKSYKTSLPAIEYGNIPGTTELEQRLINYENGDYPRSSWLDKLSLLKIEKQRSSDLKTALSYDHRIEDADHKSKGTTDSAQDDNIIYFLYLELPNFELPIVYSDTTYNIPNLMENLRADNNLTATDVNANTSVMINTIDIPMAKKTSRLKVYDPDFDNFNLQALNVQNLNSGNTSATSNNNATIHNHQLDPIEVKYHKLERNINNNSILDKELKPTPQLRDELLKILMKPSNIELTEVEKNLVWKFRYYFSKNSSNAIVLLDNEATKPNVATDNTALGRPKTDADTASAPSPTQTRSTKSFLTKFLKSINWDNDYELDHAFNEIIPNYWTVDKIQIGDALELLSSYFNPYTLTSELRRRATTTPTQAAPLNGMKDQLAQDEAKFKKVLKNVVFLRKFAVNRLRLASGEELLLYLLQLVQALKYESIIFEKASNGSPDGPQIAQSKAGGEEESIMTSPLAKFLIEKSIENEKLGNFFYWYVKVENEDQINNPTERPIKIYSLVLNRYIEDLKKYSATNKLPNYNHLKRQIWFIKKMTTLVELLRTTFKKNEATAKKVQFLRDYLADSSNELLKFPEPFPLPLDPSVYIIGCYPSESSVFKSSLAPLKITFKTVSKAKDGSSTHSSQIFGGRKSKQYGKYPLMFKIGDDLRQDQLVIQIINLMDQLLKNENLDLRLTPYKILATSPIAGLIQFVPNETLDTVLAQAYPISVIQDSNNQQAVSNASARNANDADNTEMAISSNGILSYLKLHSRELQTAEPEAASVLSGSVTSSSKQNQPHHVINPDLGVSSVVLDNYVKSCAGYCVITYLLGVGDRHLDNLLLSPNGKFWHADYGYILGRDPKPFPPLMKLPIQVIDGMGGLNHENYSIFKSYCFITYTTLRKNSNLILNLFQLMLDANIPDIKIDPKRAVEKVQEKFCLEMTEEEAILHFQNLINDSVNAFLPVVIDRLHSFAQYWRA